MRVAIFTDNDFGKVNGVTTALSAVLRFTPKDVAARVYTSADEGADTPQYLALRAPGVGIPFYPEMKMYWPRVVAFLRRARADGIDLVHYTTPGPIGLAAMVIAARLQVPMVGSFHTLLAEYAELLSGSSRLGHLMRQYQRWTYGKCVRVLAPSEATRALLVKSGLAGDRVGVWPRGVDVERFSPVHRSASLRASWRVHDGRPAILYVGRLSREKGLDAIPRLSRHLLERGLDHRLVFVGDGPFRRTLEAACPGACFTGSVSHETVAVLMASADIFLFPSRTDTFGNVVLEAQASGLPVIVTDAGGPQESVCHADTGYVCAEQGPVTMAQALEWLVRDANRRAAMGRAALARAGGRTWPVTLAPLFDAWREAARAPVRSPARSLAPFVAP